jgi:hypothetical protein
VQEVALPPSETVPGAQALHRSATVSQYSFTAHFTAWQRADAPPSETWPSGQASHFLVEGFHFCPPVQGVQAETAPAADVEPAGQATQLVPVPDQTLLVAHVTPATHVVVSPPVETSPAAQSTTTFSASSQRCPGFAETHSRVGDWPRQWPLLPEKQPSPTVFVVSAGQSALVPLHSSAASHGLLADRHSMPERSVVAGQAAEVPSQTPPEAHAPTAPQTVPDGRSEARHEAPSQRPPMQRLRPAAEASAQSSSTSHGWPSATGTLAATQPSAAPGSQLKPVPWHKGVAPSATHRSL